MKRILFLFLVILMNSIHAYEVDKINSGDTLEIIAKRNLGRVWMKYGEDYKFYATDIKKWNPKIKDWENPTKNQIIYVDYPYDTYASGSTWTPILGIYEEPTEFNRKFFLSVFYSSSFG